MTSLSDAGSRGRLATTLVFLGAAVTAEAVLASRKPCGARASQAARRRVAEGASADRSWRYLGSVRRTRARRGQVRDGVQGLVGGDMPQQRGPSDAGRSLDGDRAPRTGLGDEQRGLGAPAEERVGPVGQHPHGLRSRQRGGDDPGRDRDDVAVQ